MVEIAQKPKPKTPEELYASIKKFADSNLLPIPADPKQWTKDDLMKIALDPAEGVFVFEALAKLHDTAREKNTLLAPTAQAKDAWQKLGQLMPEVKGRSDTQNLIHFVQDIQDVAKQTLQQRTRFFNPEAVNPKLNSPLLKMKSTSAVLDIEGVSTDPVHSIALDEKKVVAALNASGVTKDGEDQMKAPLDKRAADFVRSTKTLG